MISVILPTYNGARFIANAIKSVIDQTFNDWELIIIDDGSSDDTEKIVSGFLEKDKRIRYFKNDKNLGIQKSLNKGLKEAEWEYIARIDDDDEWIDRDKLKKQFEFLEKNNDYVLVGTGAIIVDEKKKELLRYLLPQKDIDIRNSILGKNCFVHSAVFFRKNAALMFNGYDEAQNARHTEDHDLWLKLGTIGKFMNFDTYSVVLVDQESGLTSKNRVVQAKRILLDAWKFRKKYPNFLKGYFLGFSRLLFFYFFDYIPFGKKIIRALKTIYKRF